VFVCGCSVSAASFNLYDSPAHIELLEASYRRVENSAGMYDLVVDVEEKRMQLLLSWWCCCWS
jgi:hypothetical protein